MSTLLTSVVMVSAAHAAAMKSDEAVEAAAILLAEAMAAGRDGVGELREYLRVKSHQRLAWAIHESTVLDAEIDGRRSA